VVLDVPKAGVETPPKLPPDTLGLGAVGKLVALANITVAGVGTSFCGVLRGVALGDTSCPIESPGRPVACFMPPIPPKIPEAAFVPSIPSERIERSAARDPLGVIRDGATILVGWELGTTCRREAIVGGGVCGVGLKGAGRSIFGLTLTLCIPHLGF